MRRLNDVETDSLGHAYELSYTVEAKCEEPGYEIHICKRVNNGVVCGHEKELNQTNPLGHSPVKTEAVAPLCLVDGNFEYYTCERDYCQKKFFDIECYNQTNDTDIIDPALGDLWYEDWASDYEDWDGVSDVTTVENPTHTRWCHRETPCSHEVEKSHQTEACTFGEWMIRVAPTVTNVGVERRQCTVCGAYQYRYCDMLESFTVTFIAPNENGEYEYEGEKYDILQESILEYGTTVVNPPAIPDVEGYTSSWASDDYNHLEDKDVIIKAVYTQIESEDISELVSEKTVEIEGGIATITLTAVADTLQTEVPLGAEPVDVILVLDQSSSMVKYNMGTNGTKTRLNALKDVSKKFVAQIYDSAVKGNVDHRVALVGFAGKYEGSGLMTPTGSLVRYDKNPDYANAFVEVRSNKDLLDDTISSITTSTGTSAEIGLEMAREILAQNKDDSRKKIVLFITDGVPTRNQVFDNTIANDAIKNAYDIKNTYGTSIYSIGVNAEDADPTDESNNINKFLHAVSSNYPNATSMTNLGTSAKLKGNYLTADDEENLQKIFDDLISKQIVNTISFNAVTFYDTITKYYTLTTENETALRNNLKSEYGILDSDIIITRNDDGTTTVEIRNITPKSVVTEDGETLYVATVSFDVTANEETILGGVFATNTDEAGVKKNGETVIKFEIPEGEVLSSGRAIIKFVADGKVYAIREVAIGDKIVAPDADNLQWIYTEGDVVADDITIIESVFTTRTWPVTWNIGDEQIKEEYHVGQTINMPEVEDSDSGIFAGWSAEVPLVMPDYELEFTALFTTHEHDLKLSSVIGDCETGVSRVYTCGCGYSETTVSEVSEHTCTATIQQDENDSIARVICTSCGKSESTVINYKAAYNTDGTSNKGKNNSGNIANTLSLDLYNNDGIEIQPDGYIYVRVYVEGNTLRAAQQNQLRVYRITQENEEEDIDFTLDGNYLILELDHFSYYVLEILDYEGENTTEDLAYNSVVCSINGHSYVGTVTAPTCTEKGYTNYVCACGVSYIDDKTDANGHSMVDGTCTICNFTEKDCGCLCHNKSGFGKFIWAIVRFFWKLFRMNPACECQVAHY